MRTTAGKDYKVELNDGNAGKIRIYDEHVKELLETGKYCMIPVVDILKNREYGVAIFQIVKISELS